MLSSSIYHDKLFQDQVIIVTGGGSGIGKKLSEELCTLGATVVISGRSEDKLKTTQQEFSQKDYKIDYVVCDIREEDQVQNLIATTLDKHQQLNGLVNNAGGQFPCSLEQLSKNGWEAVVRNNLTGTFLMSKEAFKQYFKAHGGSIVNVLLDFHNGFPMAGHTGAARAGVDNFTKTAALEWSPYNVRINSVAPGIVDSSGLESYPSQFKDFLLQTKSRMLMQRFATESEVSSAIIYLLSPASAFMTGTCMRIDGGQSLCGPMVKPDEVQNFEALFESQRKKAS